MADKNRPREVDGYSLVRAVRQARAEDRERISPTPATSPPAGAPPVEKPGARIGHTAMPTKQEIFCYVCGYSFFITGKVQTLYCPKCRKILEKGDHTLEGESTKDITTTGNIRLVAGAVLKGGTLIARDVIVAGQMEGGQIKAFRRVEIEPDAIVLQECVTAQDLRVAPGARVVMKGRVLFRNVEVAGELRGHFACSGLLTVLPGGHFRGTLRGAHLAVEEGGGLTGDFQIEPAPDEPAKRKVVG